MGEPFTLGVIAAGVLSGALANPLDRLHCVAARKVQAAFLAGLAEPRNHDLARAIRRAQLLALKLTVKAYEDLPHPRWDRFAGYSPDDIAVPLTTWIKTGLAEGRSLALDDAADVDDAARVAHAERVRTIEAEIERVFVEPAPHEGDAAARQARLKACAEDWVLTEARLRAPDARDWDSFARLLREGAPVGAGTFRGFWPMFRAFLAEEIKRDDKVKTILAQQGIAKMLEAQEDLSDAVGRLQEGMEDALAALREGIDAVREAAARAENAAAAVEAGLVRLDAGFAEATTALRRLETRVALLPDEVAEKVVASLRTVALHAGAVDPVDVAETIRARPTELLIARYGVIPYLDRGGILAALMTWLEEGEARPRGRLYVAGGGFGKTRLAIEAVAVLTTRGWRTGFLSRDDVEGKTVEEIVPLLTPGDAPGVLVVLDYAEGQIEVLRRVAKAAAKRSGERVRILALARSSEGWWDALAGERGVAEVMERGAHAVLETPLGALDRARLHAAAAIAFTDARRAYGHGAEDDRPPLFDLAGPLFGRPLGVAMAAYLATTAAAPQGDSVFATMFREERGHWRRVIGKGAFVLDDDPRMISLHRLMTQVTLVQGADAKGAHALMQADPRAVALSGPEREASLSHARTLYGALGGGLRPIEPDILGEHIAMAALAEDMDEVAAATFVRAADGAPLADDAVDAMLTVLTRAQRDVHEPGTRGAATAVIAAMTAVAPGLEADAARRAEKALPDAATNTARLAVAISLRAFSTAEGDEERARTANNYAIRLSVVGEVRAALEPARIAVEIRERLAAREPDRFMPHLATSLTNYASRLSEVGDVRAALVPAYRAVETFEILATMEPLCFLPNLALSLSNYASCLNDVGDARTALGPARRAAEIYEVLSATEPLRFLPDLGRSLRNYALNLSDVGERHEALEPARRSSEICELLAAAEPARFMPALAHSLSIYAMNLAGTGEMRAALEPARRAVELREILAASEPARYLPELAISLSNDANALSNVGEAHAALEPALRSVDIHERLAATEPARFLPDLAWSVGNYSAFLSGSGALEASLAPARRAVHIFEQLAKAEPARFLPNLAVSLHNYANRLIDVGEAHPALEPARRAVSIRENLAEAEPARFLPDLAASLIIYASRLSEVGETRSALKHAYRAVEICETLAGGEPARFLPDLAKSYFGLGRYWSPPVNWSRQHERSRHRCVQFDGR